MGEQKIILGLDISTSVIGVCIYADKLVKYDYLKFKPKQSKFEKWNIAKKYFQNIKFEYHIDEIFIEEALLMFQKGRSRPKVLASLRGMNDVISYICSEIYEMEPKYISVNKARKLNKIVAVGEQTGKEAAFEFVKQNEPDFVVELNRNGNIKKEMLDCSDSIVIARAGKIMLQSSSNARKKSKTVD